MKRKWTVKKRRIMWGVNFLCLLVFSLLCSGCSYHDRQFSYFNMLDTEKRTLHNKKTAEKFWSSVRPVSTLSASHYKLGLYYQQKGKYDKAIEEFSKAIRNDSRYCKAYNGIAMSFDALHRCEKAHDSYGQAIQCDPKEAYLYNNYAYSSLLCGDYEKGLALLLEAVELSGENSRIKNNLKLAQMINDRENNSVTLVSQDLPVALVAKTGLKPAENEVKRLLADQVDELPVNFTPEEGTQRVVVNDRGVVERAERSPVNMSGLVAPNSERIISPTQPESSVPKLNGAVEVSNGNGVTGMAGRVAGYFRGYGFNIRRITNAKHFRFSDSVILYRKGYLQMAKKLAMVIPGAQDIKQVDSLGRSYIGVRILLGKDLVNVQFPKDYALNIDNSRIEAEQLAVLTTSVFNLQVAD